MRFTSFWLDNVLMKLALEAVRQGINLLLPNPINVQELLIVIGLNHGFEAAIVLQKVLRIGLIDSADVCEGLRSLFKVSLLSLHHGKFPL